jgi:hypothetical protein
MGLQAGERKKRAFDPQGSVSLRNISTTLKSVLTPLCTPHAHIGVFYRTDRTGLTKGPELVTATARTRIDPFQSDLPAASACSQFPSSADLP